MLNDLLGIVELLFSGSQGQGAPIKSVSESADRLSALHKFVTHIDRELPQVIAESLHEAGDALSADVAMLMEVQDSNTLFIAYSSDPSLLEQSIPWVRAARSGVTPIGHRVLETLELADAVTSRMSVGNREWLLAFGSRASSIDRTLFDAHEKGLCDLFTTLLRKRDGDAAQQANTDFLTGLPDRWATMRRISEAVIAAKRNNSRAAVLFVDVNEFKEINDTLGHAQGDKVLRAIATRMRTALRANEFVGRIGGDEFAVVLSPLQSVEDAERVAQRLYDGAQEKTEFCDIGVSLGIGIALYPDHADDQEQWLHHADLAMYRAKRQRLPYCIYDKTSGVEERKVVAPILRAERAFEQQFLLCFQPIFDVQSGRVASAEALIRLLHPQDGVLSAASAISAAGLREKHALDMWVVRKSLRYAQEWHQHGIERVHVNLGDYGEETYLSLMQTITSTGIDPQRLAIELESSSEEANYDRLKHFVGLLNGTGALVGIDDFAGTPIDLIPICELGIGFVKLSRLLLPSSGMSGKGAQAIVALANALEWEVIATRVASSDDRRLIRSAGVHYMQGFECAQPMTAVDFQSWVESTAVDVGILHGT